jgi:hypothetical protein
MKGNEPMNTQDALTILRSGEGDILTALQVAEAAVRDGSLDFREVKDMELNYGDDENVDETYLAVFDLVDAVIDVIMA